METPNTFEEEIPTIHARDIYLDSAKDYEATREALLRPTTPIDILVEIAEGLPWFHLEEFAPLLVAHPNFTDETLERIVADLKIQWWGDDPIECRIGWETLERERKAYLQKIKDVSFDIYATD